MNLRVPLVERLRARIDRLAEERDAAVAENAMLKLRLASVQEQRDRWRARYYDAAKAATKWRSRCALETNGRLNPKRDLRLVKP